ncbi:MAG TPA: hypothetical protein VF458_19285 [Ktedonobacteraceae bacterium]
MIELIASTSGEIDETVLYRDDLSAEEKDLEQRLRAGEHQAMNDVYGLLQPRMLRRARLYIRDYRYSIPAYLEPMDLVQEANLIISKRLEEARTKAFPLAYLIGAGYRSMLFFCYSHMQESTPVSLDRPRFEDDDTPLHEHLPTSLLSSSPYEHENEERYTPLYEAIGCLSESQRLAVVHSYGIQEHAAATISEIQHMLNWSRYRVSHQRNAGLAALALALKEDYPQYMGATPPTGYQLSKAQYQRLDRAYETSQAQGRTISINALAREAKVGKKAASSYLWEKEGTPRLPSSMVVKRIDQAYATLQSQKRKVTGQALSEEAGVNINTALRYLKKKRQEASNE